MVRTIVNPRYKCDEAKPRCSHCVRHEKPCVYLPSNDSASPIPPQSEAPTVSNGTDSPSAISPYPIDSSRAQAPSDGFDLNDMALFHHWSFYTSVSIINVRQIDHNWQKLVPEVAFRSGYVMHSILSLTALHVAYLHPAKKPESMLVAAQHHSKALDGFREDIGHVCAENSDSLFVNAVLTFFYAFLTFGNLFDSIDSTRAARTSRILGADWIPLFRGVRIVLEPVYEWVRLGPLVSMLDIANFGDIDPDTEQTASPFNMHIAHIREIWQDHEYAVVYNETLHLLRKCQVWSLQFEVPEAEHNPDWGYNRSWSAPFVWLSLVSERYIVLLNQRQPPALVIFAWYGAFLHFRDHHWWMEGCGRRIVDAVDECLGPYWDPWTKWPKQAVQ